MSEKLRSRRKALFRRLWGLALIVSLSACKPSSGFGPEAVFEQRPLVSIFSVFAYPWVWTDEAGQSVRFSRWRGQPIVLTAVYTRCVATCPRTISKLRALYDNLRREGQAPQFFLVTLDPDRDTPGRLLRFKESEKLPEPWHLLTGTARETQELEDALGIHVMDAGAHIVHDGRIVIFDAEGRPARSFGGWALDEEALVL